VAAITYAVAPSVVGQLGMWVVSIALVTGLVAQLESLVAKLSPDFSRPSYALAMVALGGGWVALGLTRTVRDREVALATGAAIALYGAQQQIGGQQHWIAYVLTAGVALAGFAGYFSTRSWFLLSAGVLATTLVVPEALDDWTGGSVSAAGLMLVAGLTLLAASALGLRLRRSGA
jgi:hypothetical protein